VTPLGRVRVLICHFGNFINTTSVREITQSSFVNRFGLGSKLEGVKEYMGLICPGLIGLLFWIAHVATDMRFGKSFGVQQRQVKLSLDSLLWSVVKDRCPFLSKAECYKTTVMLRFEKLAFIQAR
jgi:hypothetical protein